MFFKRSSESLPSQLVLARMMPFTNEIMMNIKALMVLLRGGKVRKGRRHLKAQIRQEALHQSNWFKDLQLLHLNVNSHNKNGMYGLRI
ncbi:hypothetical protein Tco_0192793 [Tanacetum coccineum]